jgi:hypothetical protein
MVVIVSENKQLELSELEQWTTGRPDLIFEMLSNGFRFIRETTTQKTSSKGEDEGTYSANSHDVTEGYDKILTNIFNTFAMRGNNKLQITQENKAPLDGSALLGAYLRSGLEDGNGKIVELTEEQRKAVHKFVMPIVPEGVEAEDYLNSLKVNPREGHKEVLKRLIYQGVSKEEQEQLVKDKYKKSTDTMLDSLLNVVDFMRTPFRVLSNEEDAEKFKAKQNGTATITSGVDLQWTSTLKAFKESMKQMLKVKRNGEQKKDAESLQTSIVEKLGTAQGCFGIANEKFKASAERRALEERLKEADRKISELENENSELKEVIKAQKKVIPQREEPKEQLSNLEKGEVTLKPVSENSTLTEQKSEKSGKQVLDKLSQIKLKLLVKLGQVAPNDNTYIENIKDATDEKTLDAIKNQLDSLDRINNMVKEINDQILKRSGFFSSEPSKKTEAIVAAFKNLSTEEKLGLSSLTPDKMDELIKDKGSKIGQFLAAVKTHRGIIPIEEASSFKEFKKSIQKMKLETKNDEQTETPVSQNLGTKI